MLLNRERLQVARSRGAGDGSPLPGSGVFPRFRPFSAAEGGKKRRCNNPAIQRQRHTIANLRYNLTNKANHARHIKEKPMADIQQPLLETGQIIPAFTLPGADGMPYSPWAYKQR